MQYSLVLTQPCILKALLDILLIHELRHKTPGRKLQALNHTQLADANDRKGPDETALKYIKLWFEYIRVYCQGFT